MNVLHVCSEIYPLLKTGGLADVTGALPFAQKQQGTEARAVVPGFPKILEGIGDSEVVAEMNTFAGWVRVLYTNYNGISLYVIDAPHLYWRFGNPYHDDNYHDYTDNYKRFALLGYIGASLAVGLDSWWKADILHAHDWHAGLACAYLRSFNSSVKSVFTIHNLAYPGKFSASHMYELNLPLEFMNINGLELYGEISYLKAGLYFSDHVNAVSPTYSHEILRSEFAYGLDGLLNTLNYHGRLSGILNGVDYKIWNPEVDDLIEHKYNVKNLKKKAKNKAALQKMFNLTQDPNKPLFVMVTRLTSQKGADLVLSALDHIVGKGGQFILLGSGESGLEYEFNQARNRHPSEIGIYIGYDENLSHKIIAGGDVIMVPSRFEPCGLTQLYGLKYGTLPLVRKTGGLADTVIDVNFTATDSKQISGTGFVFEHADHNGIVYAIDNVFSVWSEQELWYSMVSNAMKQDFSWDVAAKKYIDLYSSLY